MQYEICKIKIESNQEVYGLHKHSHMCVCTGTPKYMCTYTHMNRSIYIGEKKVYEFTSVFPSYFQLHSLDQRVHVVLFVPSSS